MDDVLEKLCSALDEELERQENVLAVCHAQYEATRAQHVDALNAKTLALELLIRDTVRSQNTRTALFRRVVDAYGLPVEHQTMTDLIKVTPEPWSSRLKEFQSRLRAVLEDIRGVVRANATLLRASKRTIDYLLKPFSGPDTTSLGQYDARGVESARIKSSLINQIG